MHVWHLAEPQKDQVDKWLDGWMDGASADWKVSLTYFHTPGGHLSALTYRTHLVNIFNE